MIRWLTLNAQNWCCVLTSAPKYKDVTYTRVAEEASDDNVKTVGNALAALYDHSLSDVVRVNEVSLGH